MDETDFDVRSILGVLQRQYRLIAATTVLALVIAVVALLVISPTYSAKTLVLYDPAVNNLLDIDRTLTADSPITERIESEVELLRSDSMLMELVERENLAQDAEFSGSSSARDQFFELLNFASLAPRNDYVDRHNTLLKVRDAITIQRRGQTFLIEIEARSHDPEKAAGLANRLAELYVANVLTSKVASIRNAQSVLDGYISSSLDSAVVASDGLQTFINENFDDIVADTQSAKLTTLRDQLRDLTASHARRQTLVSSIERDAAAAHWLDLTEYLKSDRLNALRAELERGYQTMGQNADPVTVSSFRAYFSDLDDRFRQEIEGELATLQQGLSQDDQQIAELREKLRTDITLDDLSPAMLARFYELHHTANKALEQYQAMLTRSHDLQTQASLQLADSRVVSHAIVPGKPSSPNQQLTIIYAIIIGLALGTMLAFAYENFVGGYLSEDQLQSSLRSRESVSIPRTRNRTARDSLADLLVDSPMSIFPEAIRRLRAATTAALRNVDEGQDGKVVMVNSATANEGKTTTALSLARCYALSGKRVLLIDCDLRNPSLHKQMKVSSSRGLYDLLDQQDRIVNVNSLIVKDPQTDVRAIVGPRKSTSPTDQVFSSETFTSLVDAARTAYDIIILDTPPVGPIVDTLYIAPSVDIVLFAVKWASTSQHTAKRAIAQIKMAAHHHLPVISVLTHQTDAALPAKKSYSKYYTRAA